jgi:hypothetical protein
MNVSFLQANRVYMSYQFAMFFDHDLVPHKHPSGLWLA